MIARSWLTRGVIHSITFLAHDLISVQVLRVKSVNADFQFLGLQYIHLRPSQPHDLGPRCCAATLTVSLGIVGRLQGLPQVFQASKYSWTLSRGKLSEVILVGPHFTASSYLTHATHHCLTCLDPSTFTRITVLRVRTKSLKFVPTSFQVDHTRALDASKNVMRPRIVISLVTCSMSSQSDMKVFKHLRYELSLRQTIDPHTVRVHITCKTATRNTQYTRELVWRASSSLGQWSHERLSWPNRIWSHLSHRLQDSYKCTQVALAITISRNHNRNGATLYRMTRCETTSWLVQQHRSTEENITLSSDVVLFLQKWLADK